MLTDSRVSVIGCGAEEAARAGACAVCCASDRREPAPRWCSKQRGLAEALELALNDHHPTDLQSAIDMIQRRHIQPADKPRAVVAAGFVAVEAFGVSAVNAQRKHSSRRAHRKIFCTQIFTHARSTRWRESLTNQVWPVVQGCDPIDPQEVQGALENAINGGADSILLYPGREWHLTPEHWDATGKVLSRMH